MKEGGIKLTMQKKLTFKNAALLTLRFTLRLFFICFLIFLRNSIQSRFNEGVPRFNECYFIFFCCSCLIRSWMVSEMLVFGFNDVFARWLWISVMMSVRMLAALLVIVLGSRFPEVSILEIWLWRIADWFEREELIDFQ